MSRSDASPGESRAGMLYLHLLNRQYLAAMRVYVMENRWVVHVTERAPVLERHVPSHGTRMVHHHIGTIEPFCVGNMKSIKYSSISDNRIYLLP